MSGHAMASIFRDLSEQTDLKSSLPHYSKAKSKLFTGNLLVINETWKIRRKLLISNL